MGDKNLISQEDLQNLFDNTEEFKNEGFEDRKIEILSAKLAESISKLVPEQYNDVDFIQQQVEELIMLRLKIDSYLLDNPKIIYEQLLSQDMINKLLETLPKDSDCEES